MPISHTTQQAHVEIAIDGDGNFRRARVVSRETIVLPATEKSANRTSGEAAHPLCDKIQYCAPDYLAFGGQKGAYFPSYEKQLQEWCSSEFWHPKVQSVLYYVRKGSVIADLIKVGVLHANDGVLLTAWSDAESMPEIFQQLVAKKVGDRKIQDQGDAFVRWIVEKPGDVCSESWLDKSLHHAWQQFYASQQSVRGFCMVSGEDAVLAEQHPAKLRHGGDKAKLISSNDLAGYTFRGRFQDADEALSIGFEVSQKAHSALRWLISRQAFRSGDQAIVSWATNGKPVPDPFANTLELFGVGNGIANEPVPMDTSQAFALRLNKAIAGYRQKLALTDDVVVMGLDSATPGRMAITFYRELKGSEFLERIEAWHTQFAWPQNFGKDSKFVGAPAPRDIAEAAYGKRIDNKLRIDEKLRKATIERLLPCIVDAQPIPRDLIESTTSKASNRLGFDRNIKKSDEQEWEKCLGIACALFKGHHSHRSYQMTLELDRISRDYLYGRLLAIAEHIEGLALYIADEKRDTTAARLMQRFADRPYSTWRTIELALTPYKVRLRSNRTGFLRKMELLLDEVTASFKIDDYTSDMSLSGEFLLGYHCQRQKLSEKPDADKDDTETNN